MKVLFFSKNPYKREEIKRIFDNLNKDKIINIDIQFPSKEIEEIKELQINDIEKVVKYKIQEIYKIARRPILVEHTALEFEGLDGYPGTQTSSFWDKLKAKRICDIIEKINNKNVVAKTMVAYCDGRTITTGFGETKGIVEYRKNIVNGNLSKFQWDTIFIPTEENEENLTFAELEVKGKKDELSMRKKAIEDLMKKLEDKEKIQDNSELYYKAIEEIKEKINDNNIMLFVGAGISRNVNMPTWDKLIKELGNKLGYDDTFMMMGDYLELAEYYKIKSDNLYDIKEIFNNLDIEDLEEKIKSCKIYEHIANLGIRTIYTTNYDSLLETAFKLHNKEEKSKIDLIYDLKTLNKSDPNNISIIKLHGDLNDIENIVLTQSSYYDRYDFENCLDIKLRADMLTKSILFIGYSFNDSNIKYMFHKLNKLWTNINLNDRPKSYIFLLDDNEIQREIIRSYNMIPITSSIIDKAEATEKFLADIIRK